MGFMTRAIAAPFKLVNSVADEIAKERRLRLTDGAAWSSLFGRESYAGKTVTIDSAMQLATVWACIKVTAQAVSGLPVALFEKKPDNDRVEVEDDPLVEILRDSPNADQTPLEFWESKVAWLLTHGNAYSEKNLVGSRLSALTPLASSHCTPFRETDGTLQYKFIDRGKTEILPRDKVFHIKGFGQGLQNPDVGLSPIHLGVNTFGTAMATEEAAGKIFANGMMASGILTSDQTLKPEQRKQLAEIMAKYASSSNAHKMMIMEAGLKYEQVALNPDDAQMLETRKFSVEEMCRWFGTPPIIIGHSAAGQTMWGSGVEQIMLSWLTLGIDPLCDRIEARIKKQLILPTGKRRRYAEFNREALLQMDSKAKASFLSTMVQNGLMDRNEGRAKLNLTNREGADQLTAQTNLANLTQLGNQNDGNTAKAAFLSWLGINGGQNNEQA